MINPVIIFGAGVLGKTALDIFKSNEVIVYGFLDDRVEMHGKEIGEVPVLGRTEDDGFLKLLGKKCDAFIAADDSKERGFLTELLKDRRSMVPVNAIHAHSSVSPYARLGHGNLADAGSRLAAFSELGDGCVLYANAVIETEVRIGNGVIVGSGAIICTGAVVEDGAFIGPGATVVSGVTIGKNASVGAGSVVMENVPAKTRVFGFPATKV